METKTRFFTPGPWRASGFLVFGCAESVPAPQSVATTRLERWKGKLPAIESQANAKLIAAAPTMADTLEMIVGRLQMDIDDGSRPDQWSMEALVEKARAALAKAYGETNN